MSMSTPDQLFPAASFQPVNEKLFQIAEKHLDNLTKPTGSLGELEQIAARLYAIGNGRMPIRVDPALLYTVAGDHGIAARNVSPYPQEVTRQMVRNFLNGGAASNVLCRATRINHKVVDAGCAGEPFPPHPLLIDRRTGPGTADMSLGPAMSVEDCIAALRAGFALGEEAAQNGYATLAMGEMGIANSTAATALYCAFLGLSPTEITGPGAGASPAMIRHKAEMIEKALAANSESVASGDPVRILAALGGFEIALLAGLMLSSASQSLPFVVDGFICASAYVAACGIFPELPGHAFLSHKSAEPGFQKVLEALPWRQRPLLDLRMRLGEGTGAALAIPLLRSAAAIYNEMATFESASVSGSVEDRAD